MYTGNLGSRELRSLPKAKMMWRRTSDGYEKVEDLGIGPTTLEGNCCAGPEALQELC